MHAPLFEPPGAQGLRGDVSSAGTPHVGARLRQTLPVEVAGRTRRKFLQPPKLSITNPLVEDRRLESIGVDPDAATTSADPFGFKELDETATPPLPSNLFVYPERAQVEPAVMSVPVGTAEHTTAPTQPYGHRKLGAIATERCRMVELFDPVFEYLNIVFTGISVQFETEIVCSWLIISH